MLGIREAEINVAEGKKQARILSSEAYQQEQINQAQGICLIILLCYQFIASIADLNYCVQCRTVTECFLQFVSVSEVPICKERQHGALDQSVMARCSL